MGYAGAIKILEEIYSGKRDAMQSLFLIARLEPDALCRALGAGQEQWVIMAMGHVEAHNKVAAIKLIREKSRLGMKEAKDVADHAENMMKSGMRQQAYEIILGAAVPALVATNILTEHSKNISQWYGPNHE